MTSTSILNDDLFFRKTNKKQVLTLKSQKRKIHAKNYGDQFSFFATLFFSLNPFLMTFPHIKDLSRNLWRNICNVHSIDQEIVFIDNIMFFLMKYKPETGVLTFEETSITKTNKYSFLFLIVDENDNPIGFCYKPKNSLSEIKLFLSQDLEFKETLERKILEKLEQEQEESIENFVKFLPIGYSLEKESFTKPESEILGISDNKSLIFNIIHFCARIRIMGQFDKKIQNIKFEENVCFYIDKKNFDKGPFKKSFSNYKFNSVFYQEKNLEFFFKEEYTDRFFDFYFDKEVLENNSAEHFIFYGPAKRIKEMYDKETDKEFLFAYFGPFLDLGSERDGIMKHSDIYEKHSRILKDKDKIGILTKTVYRENPFFNYEYETGDEGAPKKNVSNWFIDYVVECMMNKSMPELYRRFYHLAVIPKPNLDA